MAACRSCGHPIRWVLTVNGKRMPLDLAPDPAGNVVVDGQFGTVLGKDDPQRDDPDVERYMPHHATCPYAGRHRG